VLLLEIKVVYGSQLIDGNYPYDKDNKIDVVNPKFLDRLMKRRRTKKTTNLSSDRDRLSTNRTGRSKSQRDTKR
jgi:hypothetical protein